MQFFKSVLFQIYLELVMFGSVVVVLFAIVNSFFEVVKFLSFNSQDVLIFGTSILFINLLIILGIKYPYGDSNTQKYDIRDIATQEILFFAWLTFANIVFDIFTKGFDISSLYLRLSFFVSFGLTSYFVLSRNKIRLIEYIKNVASP